MIDPDTLRDLLVLLGLIMVIVIFDRWNLLPGGADCTKIAHFWCS